MAASAPADATTTWRAISPTPSCPGVGISIGLTRLFSKLKEAGLLQAPARTPAEVLVTTMEGQDLGGYLEMARMLREAGINTEVYLEPAKLKNQLAYAEKKGLPRGADRRRDGVREAGGAGQGPRRAQPGRTTASGNWSTR